MDDALEDLDPTRLWIGLLNKLRDRDLLSEIDVREILDGAVDGPPGSGPEDRGPRLREAVVLGRGPGGETLVEDPVAWRIYEMDARALPLLVALDGERTWAELLAAMEEAGESPGLEELHRFCLRLETLDLLATDRSRARLREARRRTASFEERPTPDGSPGEVSLTRTLRLRRVDHELLEDRLRETLAGTEGGSGAALEAAGSLLDAVGRALREEAVPGETVPDAAEAIREAEPRTEPPAGESLHPAVAGFLVALYRHFYRVLVTGEDGAEDGAVREILHLLHSLLVTEVRPTDTEVLALAIEAPEPVPVRAIPLDEAAEPVREPLVERARERIASGDLRAFPTSRRGFGVLCLDHYLVTRLARYRAGSAGREAAGPDDLASALETVEGLRPRGLEGLLAGLHPPVAALAETEGSARPLLGREG